MDTEEAVDAVQDGTPSTRKIYPVFGRSIVDIVADLSKPIATRHIKVKPDKSRAKYIEWHVAASYLDLYAPGWEWVNERITIVETPGLPNWGKLIVVGTLRIFAAEGTFDMDGEGIEDIISPQELDNAQRYGDMMSNATAMAMKRAGAKRGLARRLYDHDS